MTFASLACLVLARPLVLQHEPGLARLGSWQRLARAPRSWAPSNHSGGSNGTSPHASEAALRAAAHLERLAERSSGEWEAASGELAPPHLEPDGGLAPPLLGEAEEVLRKIEAQQRRLEAALPRAVRTSPEPITLLQTGASSDVLPSSAAYAFADAAAGALLPTPTPFDVLTAQPVPPRGAWGEYPPEPKDPVGFPEPPPAPVPLFSLALVEIAPYRTETLRVTPCAALLEDAVLAVGLGGPSEEYALVRSANCSQMRRADGSAAPLLEVALRAPLRFEHGDGERADAMPARFQVPTRRLHARWEPAPPPEYTRALELAGRAATWVTSHAARPPSTWAPRDLALALALSLLSFSAALLCVACCLLGARQLARAWQLKRVGDLAAQK